VERVVKKILAQTFVERDTKKETKAFKQAVEIYNNERIH
jgi:hypothetical protein